MQCGEKSYTFISDPTHKENLSGRVTAACLNCRRKKIKCSGEINCVQCQEKGLHCSGPPSRKRPRRDQASSVNDETSFSKQACFEHVNNDRSTPSPIKILHEDSCYSSLRTGSNSSSHAIETAGAFTNLDAAPPGRPRASNLHVLTNVPSEDRHGPLSLSHYNSSQTSINSISPTDSLSRSGQTSDMPASATSSKWSLAPSFQDDGSSSGTYAVDFAAQSNGLQGNRRPLDQLSAFDSWWLSQPQNSQEYPGDLITAAQALEEQEQNLRLLASRHSSGDSSSRQMTQLTRQPASSTSQSQSRLPQFPSDSFSSIDNLDGFAWYRPDGNLHSGFTPGVQEYGSFMQLAQDGTTSQSDNTSQITSQAQIQEEAINAMRSGIHQGRDWRSQMGNAEGLSIDGQVSPHDPGRSPERRRHGGWSRWHAKPLLKRPSVVFVRPSVANDCG